MSSRNKLSMIAISILGVVGLAMPALGQIASGGPYSLLQSAVSGGGGHTASASFDVISTIGQPVAGTGANGGSFNIQSGFWQRVSVLTAAGVTVSGRVTTSANVGLRNARVQITDSHGVSRTVLTGAFGYYSFEDVQSGDTYVVSVASRRFQFVSRVVGLKDNLGDLDFVALP